MTPGCAAPDSERSDNADANDEDSAEPEASADRKSKSEKPEREPEQSPDSSSKNDSENDSAADSTGDSGDESEKDSNNDPDPDDNNDDESEDEPQCGDIPFDAEWLKQRVSELSGAIPATVNGKKLQLGERFTKEGRDKARLWLKAQFEALGYKVSEHKFSRGVNVIASKAGNSDKFFVFSAHHDTVRGSPGADDDAAGVTSILAVAAALAPCDLEYSVRFISFDQEENGLIGSGAYVKQLRSSGEAKLAKGDIQIEMSAYDSDNDGSFNIIDCDEDRNEFLGNSLKEAIKDHSLALLPHHECTTASDHASFWDINVPAIVVSQLFFGKKPDRTPCYHQSCDKVDILNFTYMNELTRGLAHASLKLLQAH